MKKFRKVLPALGLSILLGGALLAGATHNESLHEVDAAGTGSWGICGTIGGSDTWVDDAYTVKDDGTDTVTIALYEGDVFKWRANGAWNDNLNVGYSNFALENHGITLVGFAETGILTHFGSAGSDDNVVINAGYGGNYTFQFADSSATTWTGGCQWEMTITYEAFATSYTVSKTAIINSVEQPVKTETFTEEGKTLADLDTAIYGYEVYSYEIGSDIIAAGNASSYTITGDVDVTINYLRSGSLNTYGIDYSAVLETFGADVYIHYWRNADETAGITSEGTTWPGIKVAPSNGLATVNIPADADFMVFNNNANIQTANISLAGASQTFAVGTTTDASSGHYTGEWTDSITVSIIRDIYSVIQDPVVQTVAYGTTLAELTSTAVYGWDIYYYQIGTDTAEDNTQITASTEVTVIYLEVDGTMSYTIDFTASPVPEESAFYYAHIWRDPTVEGGDDGASSDIKLPITAENMVTVRVPADATAFLIWNSPDANYRLWQTLDIVATGLLYDAYKITGIDETYTDITHYTGKWDSNVDDFLAKFFEKTSICMADGSTDTDALAEAWALIETDWNALTDLQKDNINSGTPDYSDEAVGTINGFLARYDRIVSKYAGTVEGITDFMDRSPSSSLFSGSGITPQDSGGLMIFLLIAGIGLIGFGAGSYLIKRRSGD